MSSLGLSASIVDWGDLGATVVASFLAAVGITAAFAFAILGAAQFIERRRHGDTVAATAAAALAIGGLAVCAAGIVFGLIVMLGD
jgi:fatty acid desaturase